MLILCVMDATQCSSCRPIKTERAQMNLCWIVPKGEGAHVRDVDTDEGTVLVRHGCEQFRPSYITPSGQRMGSLYDQAGMNADDLACPVENAGLALFVACTTIQVHKPHGAAAAEVLSADSPSQIGRSVT